MKEKTKRVGDGDEFIRDLWNIHLKVKQEGYTQVRLLKTLALSR